MINIGGIAIFFLLAIIAVIIIAAVVAVVYYAVYNSNINKALEGDKKVKSMPAPYKVLLGIIIAALLILTGIMAIKGFSGKRAPIDDKYRNGIYGFSVYGTDNIPEYLSVFSIEENSGYTKKVEKKGDIKFTYFIDEHGYNIWHPKFLIFVEYVGSKNVERFGYQGTFMDNENNIIHGFGTAGGKYKDYFVVVGNANTDYRFSLKANFMKEGVKDESEISAIEETLIIELP